MTQCGCLNVCPYFENDLMKEIDYLAELRQKKYCKGDNSICSRYIVFKALGKENVPRDLFPSEVQKAKELINKKILLKINQDNNNLREVLGAS